MIIAGLKGGLGNQMFQYAAGKCLASNLGVALKLDNTFLIQDQFKKNVTHRKFELAAFNITESLATREEIRSMKNLKNSILRKLFPESGSNPYVVEKHFHFDPRILKLGNNTYLDGHWMSEKYFIDIEQDIRNSFCLKKIAEPIQTYSQFIRESNAVCIQVRRGDYVLNPDVTKVHGVTPLTYFNKSANMIYEMIQNPVFFIFSDDSTWCKNNLNLPGKAHYVEDELKNSSATSVDFMFLMSICKHFIISNSTFGWWGAWLSSNKSKIVMAPEKWYSVSHIDTSDIYPPSWTKISVT